MKLKSYNIIYDMRINKLMTNLEIYQALKKSVPKKTIGSTLGRLPVLEYEFDLNITRRIYHTELKGLTDYYLKKKFGFVINNLEEFCEKGRSKGQYENKRLFLEYYKIPYTRVLAELDDDEPFISQGSIENLKETREIFMEARKVIKELLVEKGMAIELQTRIMNRVDLIIKECIRHGINAERLGKGDEVLKKLGIY